MQYTIIEDDCIAGMQKLPDDTVHCCVTSPPYWGLRDYNHAGQIGLEKTPEEYVARMVAVFREVKRILRDDATLWLNLGDSYWSDTLARKDAVESMWGNRPASNLISGRSSIPINNRRGGLGKRPDGLKPKDLVGIPWRVALALQADGWFLRQDIIWNKPNPMPESVDDRCTKAHEYIFLMSKRQHYFYDHEAIREPVASSTVSRLSQKNLCNQTGSTRVVGKTNGNMRAVGNTETRNRRSVWTVGTKGYRGAHFAVYPEELIEPCVLAGCPSGGIVFDPFTGSGTTAVVALRNSRNFIGTELNPEYCKIARNRIQSVMPLYAAENAIQ